MSITHDEIRDYAGVSVAQHTDEVIQDAIAAESAAQGRACKIPAGEMPADLLQALKRRVVRNLAMRALPLGVQADETGGIRLGSNDPEIRRLEGPHRTRRVG